MSRRERRVQTRWEKMGATPGKLALVAVLAVALGWVVVPQLWPASPANPAPHAERAASRPSRTSVQAERATASASKPPAVAATKVTRQREWSLMPLEEVLAHDPFAIPAWHEVPVAAPSGTLAAGKSNSETPVANIEALRAAGTAMIAIVGGEPVARMADKTLRIGDTYEGFVVADITPQGVVLTAQTP